MAGRSTVASKSACGTEPRAPSSFFPVKILLAILLLALGLVAAIPAVAQDDGDSTPQVEVPTPEEGDTEDTADDGEVEQDTTESDPGAGGGSGGSGGGGGGGGGGSPVPAEGAPRAELPRTGSESLVYALLAAGLLMVGFGLRGATQQP